MNKKTLPLTVRAGKKEYEQKSYEAGPKIMEEK